MGYVEPSKKGDDSVADLATGRPLEETVRLLVDELRAARVQGRRRARRLRLLSAAIVVLIALAGWSAQQVLPPVQAQTLAPLPVSPMSSEERAARRAELVASLPADARRKLETFEREVAWLTDYMQTWEEGQAGPVIAMMLFRMSQNMDAMPSMEGQMRTMSAQMGALPAIVAELNQINAKMHVITASMDSTMGRAGRMMPWMPFSP